MPVRPPEAKPNPADPLSNPPTFSEVTFARLIACSASPAACRRLDLLIERHPFAPPPNPGRRLGSGRTEGFGPAPC